MARPLRIEFVDAVYHVTSRGDRQEPIFVDDKDRVLFIDLRAQALERFDASALAYCLMGNHYHVVLRTRQPNLSLLMRHVNGVYTQRLNRRHGTVGHVFQGRYKAILVDRDNYLLEVCRYVDLNPVRAGMATGPQHRPWSSYRALAGAAPAPPWLDTAMLHGMLLGRTPSGPSERRRAARMYVDLVASARDAPLWSNALRQQVYLGDEAFVAHAQARAGTGRIAAPRARPAPRDAPPAPSESLSAWLATCPAREVALYRAYREGGLTMTAMARELGLSVARVSQLVAKGERAATSGP